MQIFENNSWKRRNHGKTYSSKFPKAANLCLEHLNLFKTQLGRIGRRLGIVTTRPPLIDKFLHRRKRAVLVKEESPPGPKRRLDSQIVKHTTPWTSGLLLWVDKVRRGRWPLPSLEFYFEAQPTDILWRDASASYCLPSFIKSSSLLNSCVHGILLPDQYRCSCGISPCSVFAAFL